MKIKYFNFGREKELNFIGKKWNLRIGTHQFALWDNFESVFNFNRGR